MPEAINPRKEQIMLKVTYNEEELKEFAGRLARATTELGEAEEQKKAIMAQFKERIESARLDTLALSRNITTGYAMKYVDCILKMDDPRVGDVTIIRTDTGEIVRVRPMTEEECQFKFDWDKQFDQPAANDLAV